MQKILVTGANGFVGHYIVEQLLRKKYFVAGTGKGNCRLPFKEPDFHYETMDFTDQDQVNLTFEKFRPTIVIHSGAMSKPDECETNREAAFKTNVSGTINLLKKAMKYHCFFIFLSTDFVFDGKKGMYKEDDPTGPVNYYGQTKLMAEEQVKQYAGKWAIARTVLVYGKPFLNRNNIVTNTAAALEKKQPLKIFDDQLRTPTYVEDLANGITSIVEKQAGGIYHLSGKDLMSPYDIALSVAEYLCMDKNLISAVKENEFDQPARRPLKTGFDISRARADLDYEPLSFEDGLKKTLKKSQ